MRRESTVYAAGAVCWRLEHGELQVLVVHRTVHKDVSFPKGKVDPGETLPQTAVREIREETGLKVALGVPLGVTHYNLPGGRPKEVHYWAASVSDKALAKSTFKPNGEVEQLSWLTPAEAKKQLSYQPDRDILARFMNLADSKHLDTFAVLVLRHAKATNHNAWVGADNTRPLAERGLLQADGIVKTLGAYRPKSITSSTALRCRQTVAPLAKAADREVKTTRKISQDSYEAGNDGVSEVVAKAIKKRTSALLCSHGPVIPQILRELAQQTGSPRSGQLTEASMLDTAAFTVVHLSKANPSAGIIAIETHEPLH